jgi:hypothetical protein
MIRYRYVTRLSPPAPFVQITVRCPSTGAEVQNLPAQIDPGADRTVLPGNLVTALNLVADGSLFFQGFGSEVIELPLYLVTVAVHDLPPVTITAALGEKEPFVLLGRDVLNHFRLLLDGPQLALEIG